MKNFFIIFTVILCVSCATKRHIDYEQIMEDSGVVELDGDSNGGVDISKGGTNATTASAARTALGLAIDSDVQAYDAATSKTDEIETFTALKTFDLFPVTPSAAPTTDYQVANKKYVDDNTIGNIVEDTTPQLGGSLDIQTFNIEGVDSTEFSYLDGVSSDIQTQLNAKEGTLANEAGLYSALSDVTDFVQTEEINTASELETVANLGAYFSDIAVSTSEANFKSITNLEIDTDIQAYNANLDTFAGIAPSANIQSFLGAATYQAALNLLLSSDFTITGAVDLTGASSVNLGPIDAGGGILEIPNGTSGTTDTTGEIFLDTDGDTVNITQPVLQMSTNGATLGYLFPIAALPQAATEDNYIMKYDASAKTVQWEADNSAAGGDSVSIDGVGVTDPDFVSTGDIDFVDTSNTVTANLNDDVVAAAEMADADHGDVSWSSGVATVEAVSGANAVDSDSYVDRSVDSVHINSYSDSTVLAEPDQLQPISDAWLIKYFPAETFPSGVTIDALHITTSATCTDVLNFEEWTQSGTASSSTVESITLSGTFTEDDGTLADGSIAADGRLMVDLPATPTDIAFYEITVVYHAN